MLVDTFMLLVYKWKAVEEALLVQDGLQMAMQKLLICVCLFYLTAHARASCRFKYPFKAYF